MNPNFIFLHLFGGSGLHFLYRLFVQNQLPRLVVLSFGLAFWFIPPSVLSTKNWGFSPFSSLFLPFFLNFFTVFLLLRTGEKLLGEWHGYWLMLLCTGGGGMVRDIFLVQNQHLASILSFILLLVSLNIVFEMPQKRGFLRQLTVLLPLSCLLLVFYVSNSLSLSSNSLQSMSISPITRYCFVGIVTAFLTLWILPNFRNTLMLLWLNLNWGILIVLTLWLKNSAIPNFSFLMSIGHLLLALWLLKCATDARSIYLKLSLFVLYACFCLI